MVDINLEVAYKCRHKNIETQAEEKYICFRHAIQLAQLGHDIVTEIDDYSSEFGDRDLICFICVVDSLSAEPEDEIDIELQNSLNEKFDELEKLKKLWLEAK